MREEGGRGAGELGMLARAFCNERLLIELNGGALRVHGLGSAHLDGTRMAEGDAAQKNAVGAAAPAGAVAGDRRHTSPCSLPWAVPRCCVVGLQLSRSSPLEGF